MPVRRPGLRRRAGVPRPRRPRPGVPARAAVPLPGEACGFSGSPAALVQSYTDHITAAHGGWPCRRFGGATIADKGSKCRERLAKVGCTDLSMDFRSSRNTAAISSCPGIDQATRHDTNTTQHDMIVHDRVGHNPPSLSCEGSIRRTRGGSE
jgi:hypothetical protein